MGQRYWCDINTTVIYLQQLDWNGSNVCYVVVKFSIHLQSTKFFSMRI